MNNDSDTLEEQEEPSQYTLVDSPGKKRTLIIIKMLIAGIILALVTYGFVFDKWSINEPKKEALCLPIDRILLTKIIGSLSPQS